MAIRHLKDGQDFGAEHFPKDFGFTGSAESPTRKRSASPRENQGPDSAPTHDDQSMSTDHGNAYAHGGHLHPHGHEVVEVEHHEDGSVTHHHAHGGHTVHHHDGRITHHDRTGAEIRAHGGHHLAHGGHTHVHPHGHRVTHVESLHDGSEIHHHAHGGYTHHHADGSVTHHDARGAHVDHGAAITHEAESLAHHVAEHERAEEHAGMGLARGGGTRVRLPRGMKPAAARTRSPISMHRAPRPTRTPTARDDMPGGTMPYGVEPSAEPDAAGEDQVPSFHRGGRRR